MIENTKNLQLIQMSATPHTVIAKEELDELVANYKKSLEKRLTLSEEVVELLGKVERRNTTIINMIKGLKTLHNYIVFDSTANERERRVLIGMVENIISNIPKANE